MKDTQVNTSTPELVSRRQFLFGSLALTLELLFTGCKANSASRIKQNDTELTTKIDDMQPVILHGVEVYGLNERFISKAQIIKLYSSLDKKFALNYHLVIGNKIEQRKEYLSPIERYLDVVVRQSAYDSFQSRKQETGIDFVKWIKMHVDLMNQCFESAKPPANAKSVLRRIIIISDDMPNDLEGSDQTYALDRRWLLTFYDKYPIDTDAVWTISDDTRDIAKIEDGLGYFWKVTNKDHKVVLQKPDGINGQIKQYVFPEQENSLKDSNGVWLDFGLVHEWSHTLWNVPDEYAQDVHDSTQRFHHFLFQTGSFVEPNFSAYLSLFIKRNIELQKRNPVVESRLHDFSDRPNQINLSATTQSNDITSIEIRKTILVDNSVFGAKNYNIEPDQQSSTSRIIFDKSLFEEKTNCWLIKFFLKNSTVLELFFPIAALTMATASGVNFANYEISFSGYDDIDKKTQIVELIDQSEIDSFLNARTNSGDNYYAKMLVAGTNTWFVWFLR